MVGTNDLASGRNTHTVVQNVCNLAGTIKAKNTTIVVTVLAIPPDAKDQHSSANHHIREVNTQLKKHRGYTFVKTDSIWRSHLCLDYKSIAKGGVI